MSHDSPVLPNLHQRRLEDELEAVAWASASVPTSQSDGPDESWIAVQMAWPSLSENHKDIVARMATALAIARAKELA